MVFYGFELPVGTTLVANDFPRACGGYVHTGFRDSKFFGLFLTNHPDANTGRVSRELVDRCRYPWFRISDDVSVVVDYLSARVSFVIEAVVISHYSGTSELGPFIEAPHGVYDVFRCHVAVTLMELDVVSNLPCPL